MKILLIGGKKFIGYHIALEAEKRGHQVTFFNRGKTYKELLPHIDSITGDRNMDMGKVAGKSFDAVIDTCAYFPHQIEKSVEVLKDSVKKYLLISTLSACKLDKQGYKETDPIIGLDFESTEMTGKTYGPLKAACEKVLAEQMGDEKSLIIRPGFIVGERDHTDRFTYWPVMMDAMEEMIVPETGDLGFQFIDVRDLAIFTINALEQELTGIYSLTGPDKAITFKEFIEVCKESINPNCKLTYVSEDWLKDKKLARCEAFPLCYGPEESIGIHCIDISKAIGVGLETRPAKETLKSALDWYKSYKGNVEDLEVGLKPQAMKEVMEK